MKYDYVFQMTCKPLLPSPCAYKNHWIITISSKWNIWKCKLLFPTDKLQQTRNNWLNFFFLGENGLVHSTVYHFNNIFSLHPTCNFLNPVFMKY